MEAIECWTGEVVMKSGAVLEHLQIVNISGIVTSDGVVWAYSEYLKGR